MHVINEMFNVTCELQRRHHVRSRDGRRWRERQGALPLSSVRHAYEHTRTRDVYTKTSTDTDTATAPDRHRTRSIWGVGRSGRTVGRPAGRQIARRRALARDGGGGGGDGYSIKTHGVRAVRDDGTIIFNSRRRRTTE